MPTVGGHSSAMRKLIAYIRPADDGAAIKARLRAEGWTVVGMREGHLWNREPVVESGWSHVLAPAYPGIVRAYVSAGVSVAEIDIPTGIPPQPDELDALPAATEATVICPGPSMHDGIKLSPPAGIVFGVNEAAKHHPCDWQVANDGFTFENVVNPIGTPGRITRRRFAETVPPGKWFALDRLGIVDGDYSTVCALRCAASTGARTIHLIGHDAVPGPGVDGVHSVWEESQLQSLRADVAAEIASLRATGVTVNHVTPAVAQRGRRRRS